MFLEVSCYSLSARLVNAIKNWNAVTFEQSFSYNHTRSYRVVAYGKKKTKECVKFAP